MDEFTVFDGKINTQNWNTKILETYQETVPDGTEQQDGSGPNRFSGFFEEGDPFLPIL